MKKLLLCFLVSATLFACTQQPKADTAAANAPLRSYGVGVDSSANIDLIKKSNSCIAEGKNDFDTYKTTYSDTAVFHDNGKKISLNDNLAILEQWKKMGLTVSFEYNATWEDVLNKPDDKGSSNHVFCYLTATFKKGDKTASVSMFQADRVKDGKIIEEWVVYDSAPITDLLK
jgi:hypothetical protein